MRKLSTLLLSAALSAALLTGCSDGTTPAKKEPSSGTGTESSSTAGSDSSAQEKSDRARDRNSALTRNSSTSLMKGASYKQMLRNAMVHDTDGDLTDHENACTPGAWVW